MFTIFVNEHSFSIQIIISLCFACMQDLLIWHTLDPMHYEMNLAKNFLKTTNENKDMMKVRRDLEHR